MRGEALVVMLILGLICGVIASAIAASKGRSAVGWFLGTFFLGFLNIVLGIIMIVIVACLSNKKAEAAYRDRVEMENRRLREQVRQERMKSETFRDYSVRRLDVHDQALGIDTRAALPPVMGTAPQLEWPGEPAGAPTPPLDAKAWYYEDAGQAKGPVTGADILRLLSYHEIKPDTLVWSEGMAEWAPIRTVPMFAKAATA